MMDRSPGRNIETKPTATSWMKSLATLTRRRATAPCCPGTRGGLKSPTETLDGSASKQELTAFLHPELYKHMQDIVVKETVEDIDQNGDGLINLEEYIGDMFSPEEGEVEPEWITTEKQQFMEFRDVNKDGVLDASEIAKWILPGEMDHADNEAKHLIHETDADKDEKITKEEILANWNMFVGSQATNFGEDLTRRHDEL
ncbi:hypothetical protein GJAV_G00217220 [Gymnothorax javanicus]|nr:hypothetical protein GJAV_G00217220 [Gymnothorax javanicus]